MGGHGQGGRHFEAFAAACDCCMRAVGMLLMSIGCVDMTGRALAGAARPVGNMRLTHVFTQI